ncbi:MAG: ATP-binding protein [Oscillospiraceae bacterium]|nr:ATP-binding protein [Oscillospiraceae bacterium]
MPDVEKNKSNQSVTIETDNVIETANDRIKKQAEQLNKECNKRLHMRRMSKILFFAMTVNFLLASAAILGVTIFSMESISDNLSRGDMANSMRIIDSMIEQKKCTSHSTATVLAQNTLIRNELQRENIERLQLLEIVNNIFAEIDLRSRYDFVTIADAEGYVIGRVHRAESGDNISHRISVSHALETQTPKTGIEFTGETTMGIMSTVPVIADNGELVGVVSVGYNFGSEQFIDELSYVTGTEVTVFRQTEAVMTTIIRNDGSEERSIGTHMRPDIAEAVLERGEIFHETTSDIPPRPSETFLVYYTPLVGLDGESMGAIFIGHNLTGIHDIEMRMTQITIAVTITTVILTLTISILIMRFIRTMIIKLENAVVHEQRANSAKTKFLSNMSHEIRTPMNAILGTTEIISSYEDLSPAISDNLEVISNSGGLLLGIINDILDFSKIEAGKLEIRECEYDVARMICESVQLNATRIKDKPIKFSLSVDANTPEMLIGDVTRIKQILNNLLSNAFKYTDVGKVMLTVNYNNGNLLMSVSDTGCGMNEEQVNQLFSEYVRFEENFKEIIEGTGLGLAITRKLINLMDGKIKVTSAVDKGSRFAAIIPQKMIGDTIIGKENAQKINRSHMDFTANKKKERAVFESMPYGKVLIVDDVETNLYIAKGFMDFFKLKSDTALSGSEAVQKIVRGEKYDVIFMDHMMPELDGIKATAFIRELGYKGTIVALTANALPEQEKMFLENGFDGFITKPIELSALNAILTRFILDDAKKLKYEEENPSFKDEIVATDDMNVISPKSSKLPKTETIDENLIRLFIKDAKKAVNTIEEILAKPTITKELFTKYDTSVHGVKSALQNIGEYEYAETAKILEMAAKENDGTTVIQQSPELLDVLLRLIEKYDKT